MRKYRSLMIVMGMIVLVCLCANGISADVGNSFSGGGGSFGGGGGSSYGGSGFGSFLFFTGGSPIGTLILVAFIGFIIYSNIKRSMNHNNANSVNRTMNSTHRICNEEAAIASIQQVDPDFSSEKFKSYASEVWITLQESWEAKDWKGVRPFESNELFNIHSRQIQEYINGNKTDHMNMQNIREVTIAQFKEDGDHEVLIVQLYASLLNYVSDDNTGKIIEGSDSDYVHRKYYLEFIRTKGVKSEAGKDLMTTNCPNCGAPTQVTSSGECEYCHSIITNGNYGWVLNKYAAW